MESDGAGRTDFPSPEEARAALEVVDQAHADLANRLVTPWWYHPVLGLIEAMLVLSFAMPIPLRLATVVVAVAGVGLLVSAYTRLTGLGMSGRYAALARGWVLGLVAIIVAAIGVVMLVNQLVVTVALAILVFVATIVFGRRADHVIRTRLRAGSGNR